MMRLFDFSARVGHDAKARSDHRRTLRGRRLDRRARKLLAACCAALAVLCMLECVVTATATRNVLTASRQIQAGDAVVTADFTPTAIPVSDALNGAVERLDDVTAYALIDIRKGDVLLPTMLGSTPQVAPGHTVIDVRLGELSQPFAPGTHVRLTAATGCSPPTESADEAADADETADGKRTAGEAGISKSTDTTESKGGTNESENTTESADAAADDTGGLCTVSAAAIVMGTPRDDTATDGRLTPIAMSANDAMRTLRAQENGPVLAVRAD
ncbi:SAF domain-containing protein [Bifidobacterium sp. AGR2158]|uniref:SAF domain-containing protein n=1 Tax=Bifidobacterium sp. AGR2158 TaxID=1280675 RepID=UPI0004233F9B|nr:SAF domain-containing protein [Bifidobacterium sp. AGR2158]